MGDLLLQIALLPLLLVCLGVSRKVSGTWVNPVGVIGVCFFVPMLLATLRLSGLQSKDWQPETYASLWLAVGAWLILPTIVIAARGRAMGSLVLKPYVLSGSFSTISRVASAIVIGAYLLSNYVQAGTVLPIQVPEIAYRLHTEFPPVLRLFARCIPAVVGLCYLLFALHRRWVDLALLAVAFIVPLTRLSRIDVALSLVVLISVFVAMPLFKLSFRRLLVIGLAALVVMVGGVELGNQRTNRFGLYEVKYERAIAWRPDYAGPAGVLAVAYGYFPLSFENFDAFVIQARDSRTHGLSSFDWFFTGFAKLNRFGPDQETTAYENFRPIASAANVPTALLPFYSDFGVLGIALPGTLYMLLWLWFFYKSRSDVRWLLVYGVYTAAFALASFQALIVSSFIAHQMIAVVAASALAQALHERRTTAELNLKQSRT